MSHLKAVRICHSATLALSGSTTIYFLTCFICDDRYVWFTFPFSWLGHWIKCHCLPFFCNAIVNRASSSLFDFPFVFSSANHLLNSSSVFPPILYLDNKTALPISFGGACCGCLLF